MTYEVTNLARGLKHLTVRQLVEWFTEEESWEPTQGQRVSVELNTLKEIEDLDWIVPKPDDRVLRHVERALKKDKIYIGRTFVVREIVGTRTDRPI